MLVELSAGIWSTQCFCWSVITFN